MKKLLILLMLGLGLSMSSQVYSLTYTSYTQIDTISKQPLSYVPYNTTIYVDYYAGRLNIDDNDSRFTLNMVYTSGDADDLFFECVSNDSVSFKVSMVATSFAYYCVVTSGSFTRIYKKDK